MGKNKNKISIGKILIVIVIVLATILISLFSNIYSVISIFMEDYFFPIFMIIALIILVFSLMFFFDRRISAPSRLKKVSDDDLNIIKEFNEIHMSDVPCLLDDYIENILFLCSDFLAMKKKIFSRDFFEDEYLLEEINGDIELLLLYNKGQKVIDAVFKYYEIDGKRKI